MLWLLRRDPLQQGARDKVEAAEKCWHGSGNKEKDASVEVIKSGRRGSIVGFYTSPKAANVHAS